MVSRPGKVGNSCDPSLREPKPKGSRGDRKWMRPDSK